MEFKINRNKPQPRRFAVVPPSPPVDVKKNPVTNAISSLAFDLDDEDEKPKKKKNLPAVIKNKTPAQIAREKRDKKDGGAWDHADTLFGERAVEIMGLIEADNRDGATTMIYKELMKMMVDIIPIVEKGVRATKGFRGVRSLNEMISQVREMIADMQAVQDKGMLGQTLIARFVRPAFLDIAMQMIQTNERTLNDILPFVPESHRVQIRSQVKASEKELARFIEAQYKSIAENIVKGLT
jgi:hypothetical protein